MMLAAALNISPSQIVITSVTSGSIIIKYIINDATLVDLNTVNNLQRQQLIPILNNISSISNIPSNEIGYSSNGTIDVVCFKEGTLILTDQGYIPIQDLKKSHLVKTFRNGYKSIHMIGKSELYHSALEERIKDQLYKYSEGVYPGIFEDLIITGGHSILVDEFESEEQKKKNMHYREAIFTTEDKYLLLACADEKASVYEIPGIFNIYHIALDSDDCYINYGIYANGLLVESCPQDSLKNNVNMQILELE